VIKFACAIETIIREKGLGQSTWAKEKPEARTLAPDNTQRSRDQGEAAAGHWRESNR
jgi:hypothetical protein